MLEKALCVAGWLVLLGGCAEVGRVHEARVPALLAEETHESGDWGGDSSPRSEVAPLWWGKPLVGVEGERLTDWAADSLGRAAALIEGHRLDQGSWCEEAQRLLVQSPAAALAIAVTHERHDGTASFAWAKPSLRRDAAAGVAVRTVALPHFPELPRDWFPLLPASADSLACKMKSEEAVMTALGQAAAGAPLSCGDLNRAAWEWAWARVDDEVRRRLDARGFQVEFLPDRELSSGMTWIGASLEVDLPPEGSLVYQVRSPRLLTPPNAPWGLGGNHYCKLLSPARAVEWLLVQGTDVGVT